MMCSESQSEMPEELEFSPGKLKLYMVDRTEDRLRRRQELQEAEERMREQMIDNEAAMSSGIDLGIIDKIRSMQDGRGARDFAQKREDLILRI